MTDRIITRHISPYVAWQGSEAEAPSNIEKINNPPAPAAGRLPRWTGYDLEPFDGHGELVMHKDAVAEIERLEAEIEALRADIGKPIAGDLVIREADLVRGVWARCGALEDEAHDKLAADLSDHERGFFKGQQVTAKSIRRSTEMPRPVLPAAPAVKVKPLVWIGKDGVFYSATPFGEYSVAEGVMICTLYRPYPNSYELVATLEAAKAAAQADYEARILAALEGGDA